MAIIKFKNNAYSTFAGGIASGATSFACQAGHGDRFPVVASPDIAYITFEDSGGNREVVKVTARGSGSDTFTIVRAQDNTTARAWLAGDVVEQRIVALELDRFEGLQMVDASDSKTTPVDADLLPLIDSAASNVPKKLTWANLKAALFAAWGGLIAAGTAKATPLGADTVAICDSAAGNATKKATLSSIAALSVAFPATTAMLFAQTAAPTGWTKSVTHNDKALRVVSGAASSGGSVAFTTAFASKSVAGTIGGTSLSTAQLASHSHSHSHTGGVAAGTAIQGAVEGTYVSGNTSTDATTAGSGDSHDHSFTGTAINLAVQYVDVIIATKD